MDPKVDGQVEAVEAKADGHLEAAVAEVKGGPKEGEEEAAEDGLEEADVRLKIYLDER